MNASPFFLSKKIFLHMSACVSIHYNAQLEMSMFTCSERCQQAAHAIYQSSVLLSSRISVRMNEGIFNSDIHGCAHMGRDIPNT